MDIKSLVRPLSRYFPFRSELDNKEPVSPPTADVVGTMIDGTDAITIADEDKIAVSDNDGTPKGILKHITWANLKTKIKSFFYDYTAETTNVVVGSTTKNLISFTTGASALTCTFTTPTVGVTYRVFKADSGLGTVQLIDHAAATIEYLRYQGEWIDVQYTSNSTYITMY